MRKLLSFVSFLLLAVLVTYLSVSGGRTQRYVVSDDPESVLIIANSNSPAEPGTGGLGASLFVAQHYARSRGIPERNIIRIETTLEESIGWADFDAQVRGPVLGFLNENGQSSGKELFRYIVPVYGVPYRLQSLPLPPSQRFTQHGYSLDMFLSTMLSGTERAWIDNPYRASSVAHERARFQVAAKSLKWRMFLVTRLDGASADEVVKLIDRTIAAESSLSSDDGVGYFDYRGLGYACGSYCDADIRVRQAYVECQRARLRCQLNDQTVTGGMIQSAPDTLWAWGWYSPNRISGEYTFLPGAVGAQLTSFSAASLRLPSAGGWVHHWLTSGITATWGATAEPLVDGYAQGDVLFANFWRGYNFAESAYLSTPQLNWMMVFVGDPLYAPHVFRSRDRSGPRIEDVQIEIRGAQRVVRWRTSERADTEIQSDLGEPKDQRERNDLHERSGHFYDPGLSESHFATIDARGDFTIRATDPWGNSTEYPVRVNPDGEGTAHEH